MAWVRERESCGRSAAGVLIFAPHSATDFLRSADAKAVECDFSFAPDSATVTLVFPKDPNKESPSTLTKLAIDPHHQMEEATTEPAAL